MERLESWKEIAAYLKRDVRTVQRWEKNEGLPVHRHLHERLGSVFAYSSELDAWRETRRSAQPEFVLGPPANVPTEIGAGTRADSALRLLYFLVASAMFAAIVVVVGGEFWTSAPRGERLQAVALTTFQGRETYPSLSPDGNYVTFAWSGPKQENVDIYVQAIGSTSSPTRVTTDQRVDYQPAWSPDGHWIAFLSATASMANGQLSRKEVRLIAPSGGHERKLTDVTTHDSYVDRILSWCPDSTCLIATDSSNAESPEGVVAISIESGEKTRLTHPAGAVLADTNAGIAPDGRSLMFRRLTSWVTGDLLIVPLGRGPTVVGEPRKLADTTVNAAWPTWLPDSTQVLFSAEQRLWKIKAGNTAERLAFIGENGIMPVVSRRRPGQNRLVYVRDSSDSNIWQVDVASGGPPRIGSVVGLSSTRNEQNPEFSPDGRRLALQSARSGRDEIWLMDPDGSNAVQLTSMRAPLAGSPRWSPDGNAIAFNANPSGQYDIYVVSATGGSPRNLTRDPANDESPSFSRDGNWVYFASNRTGVYQVWKVPVTGGDVVQMTRNGGFTAFESLDGAYLYYTDTTGPLPSTLWRMPVSGGEPVAVLSGVIRRAFAVTARGIYYLHAVSGGSIQLEPAASRTQLNYFEFATGTIRVISRDLGEVRNGLTVSRDEHTILYSGVDYQMDLMLVENFQ